MPSDVLITQNGWQVAGDFVRRVNKAASRDQHGRSQRTRDADYRQELGNVWRQSERHWTIGIQLTWQFIYIQLNSSVSFITTSITNVHKHINILHSTAKQTVAELNMVLKGFNEQGFRGLTAPSAYGPKARPLKANFLLISVKPLKCIG